MRLRCRSVVQRLSMGVCLQLVIGKTILLGTLFAVFARLLTLHPSAAGKIYAAYEGVYIAVALGLLHLMDGVSLTLWETAGAGIVMVGMAVIVLQPAAS